MNSPDKLIKKSIQIALPEATKNKLARVELFESIPSTNDYLLDRTKYVDNKFMVCLANHQTQGKGRNGTKWISPADANIYLSIGKVIDISFVSQIHGLSLACGVSIARLLNLMGIDVKLKWPNDILYNNKKLAGILIETRIQGNCLIVVIGVGLNVDMSECEAGPISQPWADLSQLTTNNSKNGINRNILSANLLTVLIDCVLQYNLDGFDSFASDWKRFDLLQGRNVTIITDKETFTAKVLGINNDCSLSVSVDNQQKTLYAADIKLKI